MGRRRSASDIARAHFSRFMRLFDHQQRQGAAGEDAAARAWLEMSGASQGQYKHVESMRRNVARLLAEEGAEALARVVNPRWCKPGSQYSCLPSRVRRFCSPTNTNTQELLLRIATALASSEGCLVKRAISPEKLRAMMLFFDHLLHDPPAL